MKHTWLVRVMGGLLSMLLACPATAACPSITARFTPDSRGCGPIGNERRFEASAALDRAVDIHVQACASENKYSEVVLESKTVRSTDLSARARMAVVAALTLEGESREAREQVENLIKSLRPPALTDNAASWRHGEAELKTHREAAFVSLRNAYFGMPWPTKQIDPNLVEPDSLPVLQAFNEAASGHLCSALKELNTHLEVEPDDDARWWTAGVIEANQKRWAAAKEMFAKALIAQEPVLPGNADTVTRLRISELTMLLWALRQ